MNPTLTNPPVIVLFGFMGTGKTTLGRDLAVRLGVRCIDCDAEIERADGRSIAEIFDSENEETFRKLEREFIEQIDVSGGAVIATGGGMVADVFCRERLCAIGLPVLLDANPKILTQRIGNDPDRPMLATPGTRREQIGALYEKRREATDNIAIRLDTGYRSIDESVHDLERIARTDGRSIPLRVSTRSFPGCPPSPAGERLCAIRVGRGACKAAGARLAELNLKSRAVVLCPPSLTGIVDRCVSPSLHRQGIEWTQVALADGDENKTLDQVSVLIERLSDIGVARDTPVITVGGGVTGDVGGFVAATYMRGVPWVNVPTSLLAQIDAGIGGKVGVNARRAKNLVGAFYHPLGVICDPDLLTTLPRVELANGYAEAIKTAMVGDAAFFARLLRAAQRGVSPTDPELLDDVVVSCVRVKARIVEADPTERDLRRVLNLGHTLGHALEFAGGYGNIRHGEAVAIGLLAALRVAHRRAQIDASYISNVRNMISWAGLPATIPDGISAEAVARAISLDKKHREGHLTFVLPIAPGQVRIVNDVTPGELVDMLSTRPAADARRKKGRS